MFKKIWKNYKFPIILLSSIMIGCIIGIIFKEDALYLKPIGTIFINMLYVIVVPLVFFTISSSISNIKSLRKLGKIFKVMFIVFIITSTIAALFMLLGVKIFDPVGNINLTLTSGIKETIDIGNKIVDMITVGDFYQLLSKNSMLPLIIFSIMFGFAVNMTKSQTNKISKVLDSFSKVMMNLIKIIMYYAPIGLCAYFAALVGEYGKEIIGSYARSMIFYYVMAVVYYIVFYTVYSYIARGKKGIKDFFKNIFTPTVTSLGTCSSLASLPSNMDAANKLNIDEDVSRTTLPIGATMHMEGSAMASILKIAFLFGVFGKSFTGIDTYLIAILIAVLSGVVMSGIPGGGLIGEMLIVSLYGFPLEAFPIIATIGWIVDPPATCLNVVGDVSSAMLIEKHVE
ncbi:MAG: dicarboxylate/amino acid:cation symporter [Bacilli bacterium]|nr:dicarboxylate/amino acid:cation symporter [Bacilli bacterium]